MTYEEQVEAVRPPAAPLAPIPVSAAVQRQNENDEADQRSSSDSDAGAECGPDFDYSAAMRIRGELLEELQELIARCREELPALRTAATAGLAEMSSVFTAALQQAREWFRAEDEYAFMSAFVETLPSGGEVLGDAALGLLTELPPPPLGTIFGVLSGVLLSASRAEEQLEVMESQLHESELRGQFELAVTSDLARALFVMSTSVAYEMALLDGSLQALFVDADGEASLVAADYQQDLEDLQSDLSLVVAATGEFPRKPTERELGQVSGFIGLGTRQLEAFSRNVAGLPLRLSRLQTELDQALAGIQDAFLVWLAGDDGRVHIGTTIRITLRQLDRRHTVVETASLRCRIEALGSRPFESLSPRSQMLLWGLKWADLTDVGLGASISLYHAGAFLRLDQLPGGTRYIREFSGGDGLRHLAVADAAVREQIEDMPIEASMDTFASAVWRLLDDRSLETLVTYGDGDG